MNTFKTEIVAPDRTVWSGQAESVTFRTLEGSMGVLSKRAPVVTALDIAQLEVKNGGQTIQFAVHGGLLRMNGEELIIVTDAAEKAEEIDLYRASEAKKRAEDSLAKAKNDVERYKANASLQKNILRMQIGKKS
ncbi:MAG TPA: ATP synthase F1 subunit epsilon [Thermotogota bacterium]|nr:ATP synthase F1 subunit epsilon [Thermotogota bacterium]HPJ89949.1 ATP synthase F1 subunit epsilon [Thermotogota bacterium]HPR97167.1 ATP synthase F1 subunit epsilon [Thermotogota bacterium]